jgi:hypothetical protein
MKMQTEQDDAREPYEPPVLRELGEVSEVTFGLSGLPNVPDTFAASVAI